MSGRCSFLKLFPKKVQDHGIVHAKALGDVLLGDAIVPQRYGPGLADGCGLAPAAWPGAALSLH